MLPCLPSFKADQQNKWPTLPDKETWPQSLLFLFFFFSPFKEGGRAASQVKQTEGFCTSEPLKIFHNSVSQRVIKAIVVFFLVIAKVNSSEVTQQNTTCRVTLLIDTWCSQGGGRAITTCKRRIKRLEGKECQWHTGSQEQVPPLHSVLSSRRHRAKRWRC